MISYGRVMTGLNGGFVVFVVGKHINIFRLYINGFRFYLLCREC